MRAQMAAGLVLVLVLVMGGANLLATVLYVHDYQAGQKQQGQLLEQRLCSTLNTLAALKPPPGDPSTNPSRAYDQQLHATLAQLSPDLGCSKG